jgi:hypothetical protein
MIAARDPAPTIDRGEESPEQIRQFAALFANKTRPLQRRN